MKKFKRTILSFFMLGMLILPSQKIKADIFTHEFAEKIVKDLTTGVLTSTTMMVVGYYVYDYLSIKHEQEKILRIRSMKEADEKESLHKSKEVFMTIYYPGNITTTFEDVAGNAGTKADVQDIMAYLKNPEKFAAMGAKVPKGLLMNGSPGNGKTLMARAIAGQVNCPFISVSGASFAEMYVGVGAVRVRLLFSEAKSLAEQYGACLIFIDEIDAVAQKRSGAGSPGDRDFNQTIAQLLQSMDGLQQNENPIIVIAATNRMEALDPAILRPGRFDRKVDVKKPEIKDRVILLKNALKKVPHVNDLSLISIARLTSGFSGAQLTQLINEAAILAVQAGRTMVTKDDIELAYDHVTLGREISGMELNQDDKWVTAVHEAGHAVGYLFGDTDRFAIHKASIVPRANTLGVVWAITLHESHNYIEKDMRAKIVVALCGTLAEKEFGYSKSTGPSSDLAKARAIAYDMVVKYGMSNKMSYISYDEIDHHLPNDIATEIHREVQRIIDECLIFAQKIVSIHKKDIENIALLLMKKGTVLGDEIYQLVHLPVPSLKLGFVS